MSTIVLIHGWDNKNYSKYGGNDAWENRKLFVEELSLKFNVIKLNLPGFAGEPEPDKPWDLQDFAIFFENYLKKNLIKPDIVLGYSFGAAVALSWKLKFQSKCKIILVSPAISRAYKKQGFVQKISFLKKLIPFFLTQIVRDLYLRKIGNRFYIDGTNFLKNTYLNIVKIDLSENIKQVNPDDVLLIFGANDTATPPSVLLDRLSMTPLKDRIKIIEGGNHNIAQTHFKEISKLVFEYVDHNS